MLVLDNFIWNCIFEKRDENERLVLNVWWIYFLLVSGSSQLEGMYVLNKNVENACICWEKSWKWEIMVWMCGGLDSFVLKPACCDITGEWPWMCGGNVCFEWIVLRIHVFVENMVKNERLYIESLTDSTVSCCQKPTAIKCMF